MIEFQDYHRLELIQHFIRKTKCTDYLEIGCDKNQVFSKIKMKNKIGVDPARGGTHRMTSDQFFERHNKKEYDVIFIDGLHYYDQVARDVINGLKVLKPHGAILIHDMLPRTPEEAIVPIPENAGVWLGDVWKLIFDLANCADIDFRIARTDCGVGVITLKDTFSRKRSFNHKKLKSHNLLWEDYVENLHTLPIVETETILI